MMTVVTRVRLRMGEEPAWDAAFRQRIADVREQQGWIGVQLGIPVDAPDERVVIGTWANRAEWEAWHATPAFQDTRAAMEAAEDGDHSETWYEVVLDEHR
jgi:heme-degrading monooxygenase HmoA